MHSQIFVLRLLFLSFRGSVKLMQKLWFLCFLAFVLTFASVAIGAEENLEIEKIECLGNEKSKCSFLLSQITLREGEKVDDEKVRESKLRLQLVGHFQDADIRLAKGSAPGKAVVIVEVKERSSRSYRATFGLVDITNPWYGVVDVTGSDRNFTGRGDTLSLRVRGDLNYQAYYRTRRFSQWTTTRLEYNRPRFFLPKMYLVGGLAGQIHTSIGSVYRGGWADLALGYKIFDYSFVAIGARHYRSDAKYRYGQWNYSASEAFFQYGWDSQDNSFFPTQGSQFLLTLSIYSKPQGGRFYFPFSGYGGVTYLKHWSLAEGHVLSLRVGTIRGVERGFWEPESQAFSLRYSRILKRTSPESEVKKTALYVEPGYFPITFGNDLIGVKTGANFQTSHGILGLFLMGGVQ